MSQLFDPTCIFCKIAAGQIPCHKLHEDAQVLAFLDIAPLSRGHLLVIPKAHYATIDQMPPELLSACTAILPRLSKAVVEVTGVKGWNILQNNGRIAGQAVDHVHFHLIPRALNDGLGFRWPAGKLSPQEAALLAQQITGNL